MHARRALLAALAVLAGAALIAAPAAGAAKGKKKGGVVKIVSAIATSSPAVAPGPLSATATCPSGRAISGGFEVVAAGVSLPPSVIESTRAGENAWRAAFLPTNEGQLLLVEVYCAKLKGSVSTVSASQQLGADVDSTAAPAARCPASRRLISGGFNKAIADPAEPPSAFVTQSRLTAKNLWQVGFIRPISATSPDQLTAHAYCLKPPKPKQSGGKKKGKPKGKALPRVLQERTTVATAPTAPGGQGTATAPPCSGKRRGVSGGFTTSVSESSAGLIQQARFMNGLWSVRVTQVAPATAGGPFTAHVYCG
jgi:hypothetical protein